jgi:endonuclease YncB( thermonuclease family)
MLETRVRRALSFIAFVLAVAAFLSVYQTPDTSTQVPASGTPTQETSSEKTTVAAPSSSSTVSVAWPEAVSSTARVTHVVDGDTVDVLVDGETKVAVFVCWESTRQNLSIHVNRCNVLGKRLLNR